ncbi:MAG TPA: hypothetical protein PKA06_06455 [Gemmatales bacterium]|nr:hypothetical protein [Gemmatales bacterium]HMP16683.1 hypothetical protein [Gemmatales bacterium]
MFILWMLLGLVPGEGELVSGPQPGKKYGSYTFLMATGPHRGTSHCYVCDTGEDPAVIILARSRSDALGELIQQLDQESAKPENKHLKSWVTFVGMKQPVEEEKLVAWTRQLGIRRIPVGIYEPAAGPPGYRLHSQADVTVLLVRSGIVKHNYAFAPERLTTTEVQKMMQQIKTLPR